MAGMLGPAVVTTRPDGRRGRGGARRCAARLQADREAAQRRQFGPAISAAAEAAGENAPQTPISRSRGAWATRPPGRHDLQLVAAVEVAAEHAARDASRNAPRNLSWCNLGCCSAAPPACSCAAARDGRQNRAGAHVCRMRLFAAASVSRRWGGIMRRCCVAFGGDRNGWSPIGRNGNSRASSRCVNCTRRASVRGARRRGC